MSTPAVMLSVHSHLSHFSPILHEKGKSLTYPASYCGGLLHCVKTFGTLYEGFMGNIDVDSKKVNNCSCLVTNLFTSEFDSTLFSIQLKEDPIELLAVMIFVR